MLTTHVLSIVQLTDLRLALLLVLFPSRIPGIRTVAAILAADLHVRSQPLLRPLLLLRLPAVYVSMSTDFTAVLPELFPAAAA